MGTTWWLTSDAERKAGWRPGGMQQLAVDARKSRLYAIMHRVVSRPTRTGQGRLGVRSVDPPGCSNSSSRTWRHPSNSQATRNRLLYSIFIDATDLDIYDPRAADSCDPWLISARHRRSWSRRSEVKCSILHSDT